MSQNRRAIAVILAEKNKKNFKVDPSKAAFPQVNNIVKGMSPNSVEPIPKIPGIKLNGVPSVSQEPSIPSVPGIKKNNFSSLRKKMGY